ncbi:tetratricopeptide repeat protein [Pseudomonas sp. NPDC077408]
MLPILSLALAHLRGQGATPAERQRYGELHERAAAPDASAEALNELGCVWLQGQRDERLARGLFIAAARYGSLEALLNLGYIHWYGKGVAVNERRALACYCQAAARGSLDARYEIGQIFLGSDDEHLPAPRKVATDLLCAYQHFQTAAGDGHVEAMYALGDLLLDTDFIKRDEANGLYWLMCAAGHGHPLAADRLARFYLDEPRLEMPDPGNLMGDFWRNYRARRDGLVTDEMEKE